jgi:MFS family permease
MFIVNIILKFFASGSYAIIYIYANELFPTQVRNTGIGICSMIARIGAIAGTLSNDLLVNDLIFLLFIFYGFI